MLRIGYNRIAELADVARKDDLLFRCTVLIPEFERAGAEDMAGIEIAVSESLDQQFFLQVPFPLEPVERGSDVFHCVQRFGFLFLSGTQKFFGEPFGVFFLDARGVLQQYFDKISRRLGCGN